MHHFLQLLEFSKQFHHVGGPISRRSLCQSWRETKQRPGLEISDETGSGVGKAGPRETRRQLEEGTPGGSWRRVTERDGWQSTPDSRSDQSALDRVQKQVREDELESRWVGIPSSFVEISWRMHVSVSLHMKKECRVSQLNLLALKLTQVLLFVCSSFLFLPFPWLYFL